MLNDIKTMLKRCVLDVACRYENKYVWSDLDVTKASRYGSDSSRRIVLCVDSSEHSKLALEWCNKKLFMPTDEVHLLHVFEFEPTLPIQGSMDIHTATLESLASQNQLAWQGEQQAIKMMKAYQKKCKEIGTLKTKPSATVMRGSSRNHDVLRLYN